MARLANNTEVLPALSCTIIIRFEMAGDVLILTSSALFTAMRVYALSGRSKILFGIVLTLGLVAPVISTYTFAVSYPILQVVTPTYQSCDIYARYTVNKMHSNIVRWAWTLAGMIGTRVSSLLFDGLVMALTWVRIRRIAVPSSDAAASKSLQAVLIKDTAVYFAYADFLG
ncbi:predicted protein [Postia placenta Mad-698-R]|nr:predicted protein [Postia placenta Mad-698-R]